MTKGLAYDIILELNAPVAQLDRVTGYEPVGRGFESLLPYHVVADFVSFATTFSFSKQTSSLIYSVAPPFQTATAMLGCGLGPPLHGGFVFPWKISILTVLSTFKRLPVSGKSFLLPDPSGSRRSGFACGAPSREGTRSGQRATGTLSIAPTSGVPLVASDNRLR